MTLKLGGVSLGSIPRIVVGVRDQEVRQEVDAVLAAGAEILEFRIDQFSRKDAAYVCAELDRFQGVPRLATIRGAREGGGWEGDEAARLALYEAVMPHAEAVDIELSSTAICGEVVAAARAAEVLTVASFHDFDRTPEEKALEELMNAAQRGGVDILKIAAQINTQEELQRLARFTLRHPEFPKVIIGMGALARLSRVFFPALGSLMTYTFLGEPTAPGQLSCPELLHYRKMFYDAL